MWKCFVVLKIEKYFGDILNYAVHKHNRDKIHLESFWLLSNDFWFTQFEYLNFDTTKVIKGFSAPVWPLMFCDCDENIILQYYLIVLIRKA